MEIWNAYDQNRQLIEGVKLKRALFPYEEKFYHLAVHVWIQDSHQNWLFMRRSAAKKDFPAVYEAGAGGSVLYGESSKEAALRELKEETGLEATHIRLLFSHTEDKYLTHFDTYLVELAEERPTPCYQLEETDAHIWVSHQELPSFLERELVFESQKRQLLAFRED